MSFYFKIRRRCHSFRYFTYLRSQRSILSFGTILFICIFIILKKKENCWSKLLFLNKQLLIDYYLVDYYRSRLFCFVLTSQGNLENRSRAVYETWGHRCGRFIFVTKLNSSTRYTIYDNQYQYLTQDQLPIQYIPDLPDETYSHLSDKVRVTFLFLHKYYPNYDWYLKADDDTYIIVENLLRFLVSTIK